MGFCLSILDFLPKLLTLAALVMLDAASSTLLLSLPRFVNNESSIAVKLSVYSTVADGSAAFTLDKWFEWSSSYGCESFFA